MGVHGLEAPSPGGEQKEGQGVLNHVQVEHYKKIGNLESYPVPKRIHGLVPTDYKSRV